MKQIKYLDIVLDIGKILYIPPYWLYSIKFSDIDSCLCFLRYRTIMNEVVNTPISMMNILQSQNIKRKYFNKKSDMTEKMCSHVKSFEKEIKELNELKEKEKEKEKEEIKNNLIVEDSNIKIINI
jgi:hypothetical protein